MEFRGQIIFLIKDNNNCIHIYKKKSQAAAEMEKYQKYILKLEEELTDKLVRVMLIKYEEERKQYVWCNEFWRTGLNEKISPNHQKYLNYLADNRKDISFIGPYKAMKRKSLHLCNRGHEWTVEPIKVKNGETCAHCKKEVRESHGAKFITNLLVSRNVEFIKEVSLKTFGYEMDLRLDFLICQNNFPLFAIEFNGIQHYKFVKSEYFGGYKGARERRKRDKLKREFCWSKGLPIVDIPYTETEEQITYTIFHFLKMYEII